MKAFIFESYNDKPNVILDPQNNIYEIKGRSFPENARQFYQPVLDWIEDFIPQKSKAICLTLDFSYISSSSIIALIEVIKKMEKLAEAFEVKFSIDWHYEEDDEDVKKIGENFECITHIPIKIIKKEESN